VSNLAPPAIVPFGDRALRFSLPPHLDRRALLAALRAAPGIADVILAEESGAVVLTANAQLADATAIVHELLSFAPAPVPASAPVLAPAHHTIRVLYNGPDLPDLAARLSLPIDDLITLHSAPDYEVTMLGFMPGFAYLRGLDPRLVVERRAEPRPRVPANSVAIAAGYTGIYPSASPGGWHLLGEALDHRPFDGDAATLAVGDRVRFERAERASVMKAGGSVTTDEIIVPRGAHLEVRRAQGPALVIDGGRIGHMHEGVPRGGPMVAEALANANVAAGNAAGAAAIEVYGLFEIVARGGGVLVADDSGASRALDDGEGYVVATEGRTRVRYLAVSGGIDVPVVLGGRGTMLGAGIGGYAGRIVKRGDRLGLGSEIGHGRERESVRAGDEGADVVIVDGPDADEGVLSAIDGATYVVGARSDRVGTRLEGEALPSVQTARDRRSTPMVQGAIELTPAGLVVLGPDHPTTGGYPAVAVVRSDSIGRLLQIPVGGRVRLARSPRKPT
jgi:KipI family sensor histidine kinase inhibitor